MRPRFVLVEDWAGTGDVDIYFMDRTSESFRSKVMSELNVVFPTLKKQERNLYRLEKEVNNILTKICV